MASHKKGRCSGALILSLLTAVLSSHMIMAVDAMTWNVGDDAGTWTIPATSNDINYTAWAASRNIRYGDKLYFRYSNITHSVFRVNGSSFEECLIVNPIQEYRSGQDIISLDTPGVRDYYFLCGEPTACFLDQKLHVTLVGEVPDAAAAAPSDVKPSSSSLSHHLGHSLPSALLIIGFTLLLLLLLAPTW
ncbi:hypothetical protein R1flu_012344 [Riccia fluitans]|uniref:Phytocyanin domain-containing protein n=1 Tax=Riccia fluitans TaxID=41844 RepID=A0ABD1ZAC9_9MARC